MFVGGWLVICAGGLAVAHPEEFGGVEVWSRGCVQLGADLVEVLGGSWFFGEGGSVAGDFTVVVFDATAGGVFDADAEFVAVTGACADS